MHTTKLTLFVVSKDELDTKEGTGKSMKSTFYEQQCLSPNKFSDQPETPLKVTTELLKKLFNGIFYWLTN